MPWIIPLATAAYSIGSSAVKASKAKKAERAAEDSLKQTPQYKPNQSILNYYNTALQRYNTSPTDTAAYKSDKQNIKQGTTQALSSLNKLRSGDVANVIQGQNNSLLKAAVNAENRKAQEFGVLGQATNMKAGQDAKAFQQNELYPFEAKYNLMTMKAAGARADQRQATQNAYNNFSAAASIMAGGDGTNGNSYTQNRYSNIYGNQGDRAYNWAKGNNMSMGQYRRLGNTIGNAASSLRF